MPGGEASMVAVLFVYLLSLICWLGAMVFFVVVTQTAFTALPKVEAGTFLAALFPRYYLRQRRDRGHPWNLSLRDADATDVVGDSGVSAGDRIGLDHLCGRRGAAAG
jgi:hypothetical protein